MNSERSSTDISFVQLTFSCFLYIVVLLGSVTTHNGDIKKGEKERFSNLESKWRNN